MTLIQSALGLAACLIAVFICVRMDKKSGVDNHRLLISIAGIMAMMCLFFLLVNILVASGALG